MAATETKAYISLVTKDHTVVVPPELPAGTTVAVIAMPNLEAAAPARRARFDATLKVIRETLLHRQSDAMLTDNELNAVIERARKRPRD